MRDEILNAPVVAITANTLKKIAMIFLILICQIQAEAHVYQSIEMRTING